MPPRVSAAAALAAVAVAVLALCGTASADDEKYLTGLTAAKAGIASVTDLSNSNRVATAFFKMNAIDASAATAEQKANAAVASVVIQNLVRAAHWFGPKRRRFVDRLLKTGDRTTKAANADMLDGKTSDKVAKDTELARKMYTAALAALGSDSERAASLKGALLALDNKSPRGGAPEQEDGVAAAPAGASFAEVGAAAGATLSDYHVIVRAFIPGHGTAAGTGFAESRIPNVKLRKRGYFGSSYSLPRSPAHGGAKPGYAGYVVGIYETDEVFDTSHRDWSTTSRDNSHSKVYTHIKLKKTSGRWSKNAVTGRCSTTHHYCDSGFWPFWSSGNCCTKRASAPGRKGVKSFRGTADKASFRVEVSVGNPCAPGSSVVGPIRHEVKVDVDFKNGKFTYSGWRGKFPALEVCFGADEYKLTCYQHGIKGRNFYSLLKTAGYYTFGPTTSNSL